MEDVDEGRRTGMAAASNSMSLSRLELEVAMDERLFAVFYLEVKATDVRNQG